MVARTSGAFMVQGQGQGGSRCENSIIWQKGVCMYVCRKGGFSPLLRPFVAFSGVGVAGKRPDGERMANHMLEDMHRPVEWR